MQGACAATAAATIAVAVAVAFRLLVLDFCELKKRLFVAVVAFDRALVLDFKIIAPPLRLLFVCGYFHFCRV